MAHRISIIIVTWNVRTYLAECIASILRHPPSCAYEVIVVDNASADGTPQAVREQFPQVRIIANTENKGFARANNQGAAVATGEYLFVLNPDTLFLPNTVNELIYFMDCHSEIGMCGPRVINEDRTLQRSVRGLPTWGMAFSRHTLCGAVGMFRGALRRWRCLEFDYTRQADAEQLIGAALVVRRDVFERVGGFDERFFMYFEEVDLCKKITQEGHRVVFYPGAEIIHLAGKSSRQIPAKKRYMVLSSLVLYLQKHTVSWKACPLTVLFKAGVFCTELYEGIVYYVGYCLSVVFRNAELQARYAARYRSSMEFVARYALRFLCGRRVS